MLFSGVYYMPVWTFYKTASTQMRVRDERSDQGDAHPWSEMERMRSLHGCAQRAAHNADEAFSCGESEGNPYKKLRQQSRVASIWTNRKTIRPALAHKPVRFRSGLPGGACKREHRTLSFGASAVEQGRGCRSHQDAGPPGNGTPRDWLDSLRYLCAVTGQL
ncbi:hypothetical protein MRX96_025947 [Rhipicephalus microplus]